jgi:hypothetical protein
MFIKKTGSSKELKYVEHDRKRSGTRNPATLPIFKSQRVQYVHNESIRIGLFINVVAFLVFLYSSNLIVVS